MYRGLSKAEIEQLEKQGCDAVDWSKVVVAEGFCADTIKQVSFSGIVQLGSFDKEQKLDSGISVMSGIRNACLHNVTIGDNCYISNIHRIISNYDIGEGVVIENVKAITCDGSTTFGNNTTVTVINETGGREVPMYDKLSSHLAYCLAVYRHCLDTVNVISEMILYYSESVRSCRGIISEGVKIVDCGLIRNVKIETGATLCGVSELYEGTIMAKPDSPTFIGRNVIAKRFIICDSTSIEEGVVIDKCFVGQGCRLGKQYSAVDSLFFANCVGMHGEATSVFAGPYTVTHHKSTLLIAGMFSFSNAGSGSNQGNHLYKLGPIHQGITERGCKTASDSFLLAPYKIGAFSIIMGRHTNHLDTSDMPFSYLIENRNTTTLVPGINIRSVGTIRDAMKWPRRDRRAKKGRLDCVNFNLLSPYTISKMIRAYEILTTLHQTSGISSETYLYQGAVIKNSSLCRGLQLYNMAIDKFLGNSLIKRLEIIPWESIDQIRKRLAPDSNIGLGEWVDISGLFAPKSEVDRIMKNTGARLYSSLEQIEDEFKSLHKNYYEYEWTWAIDKICNRLNKNIVEITKNDIVSMVHRWKESVTGIDNALYEDAKKEFTFALKTSFGADGDLNDKMDDFYNVRGELENNDFVHSILEHITIKTELGNELLDRIKFVK